MVDFAIFELLPVDGRKSFYGKAQVIWEKGWRYLYSYQTLVCGISPAGDFVRFWGSYSATTMRHINAFLAVYDMPGGGKSWWCSQPVKDWEKAVGL